MYRYLNIQQLKRTKLRNYHQLLLYFVIIYLNANKVNTLKILKQTINVTKVVKTLSILLVVLNLYFCYGYFNSQTLFKL